MVNAGKRIGAKAVIAAALAIAAPAFGGGPSLAMLDQLAPGRWEMRDRAGTVVARVCVASGRKLVQLRHPGRSCESFVLKDTAGEIEVQYTCPGQGYGRTRIRRETNRLIQLDSQGIVDGLPFDLSVEARRVGDCTAG